MGPEIRPWDILQKRLEVIRALLGPGWLGVPWCDWQSNGITSTDMSLQSWCHAEQTYDQVVSWLIAGLDDFRCRVACADKGAAEVVLEGPFEAIDVPVIVLEILRKGLIVRPAGIETSCRIEPYDLLQCIVPFLAYLYCLHDQRLALPAEGYGARSLVALSAVPGAGKSVLGAVLEEFSRLLKTHPRIQVIGMDGWHYSNEELRRRRFQDESGQDVSLASRKGSSQSFDIQGLVSVLDRLLSDPSPVYVPAYDRGLHEPVADAVRIEAPIVLVEGNYLLMRGQGWETVERMVDAGVWLEVPLSLARNSILLRHKVLGRNDKEIDAKWRGNDWPNSLTALRGRSSADAVVYVDNQRGLRFVQRPGKRRTSAIHRVG